MNRIVLAAFALVSPAIIACSASAEPPQSEGVHEYSVSVASGDGQKTADDITAHGASINGQVCYPITRCSVKAAGDREIVTASMCCPGQDCYVDTGY